MTICALWSKPGSSVKFKFFEIYFQIAEKMEEIKRSLLDLDVELEKKLNPNIYDREIRIDNGWTVKIGRGLDLYQNPGGWFEVGANDMSLRKCFETKLDTFRN